MPTIKKNLNFLETEEGKEAARLLTAMAADAAFNTGPSYSADTNEYPNNLIPFVNKHMDYLRNHPATNPSHYLANLRLMTRIK
jgi:hypothetical protein